MLIALAVGIAAMAGCGLLKRPVPIADLVSHPQNYEGHDISIRGRATAITRIPFVEIRFFVISDGKQGIPVVTYDSLPSADEDVTVSGTFSTVAIIGGVSIGPHLTVGKPGQR